MRVSHLLRFSTIALIAAAFASPRFAHAVEPWQYATITWEQPNGYVIKSGYGLYTKDQDKRGAAFACINGTLVSAFSMAPKNLHDSFVDEGPAREVYVRWAIGDEKPVRQRWVRQVAQDVLLTGEPKSARKLFNAAIRGDRVSIETKRYGSFTVDLPKATPALFNRFVSDCEFKKKNSED